MKLSELFTDQDSDFEKALKIATKAHEGQKRKIGGGDYIEHPIRVSKRVLGDAAKIVAILHDVIEDTPVTAQDLLDAGFSKEIVEAVVALSKQEGETYKRFVRRAAENPLARMVKVADIEDNMSDLPEDHSLRKRYTWGLRYLRGMK